MTPPPASVMVPLIFVRSIPGREPTAVPARPQRQERSRGRPESNDPLDSSSGQPGRMPTTSRLCPSRMAVKSNLHCSQFIELPNGRWLLTADSIELPVGLRRSCKAPCDGGPFRGAKKKNVAPRATGSYRLAVTYRGRRAATVENAALRVTVLEEGGHIAEITRHGHRDQPAVDPALAVNRAVGLRAGSHPGIRRRRGRVAPGGTDRPQRLPRHLRRAVGRGGPPGCRCTAKSSIARFAFERPARAR